MSSADKTSEPDRLIVHGIELEILRRGRGPKLLLLHGMETIPPQARFLDLLARHAEIIAPSSPGFGRSPRPDDVADIYDLVHLYLEVLEAQADERVSIIGFSFGGWLAAEMAAACCHRVGKLVLVDAFGIKTSGPDTPDILDIFNTHPRDVAVKRWRDPARWAPDFNAMTEDEIVLYARNREALCLYGWHPYMYNPRLKRWLARIRVPTLVLWGAQDGIVTPSYGRRYCELIPGARFAVIDDAGLPKVSTDNFAYAALVYVGDTDEEGLRVGSKLLWFLNTSLKSAPQYSRFLPGAVPPRFAPQAWRTAPPSDPPSTLANAEKGVAPAGVNAARLISITPEQAMAQGILFAGNPDSVYRQIVAFYDKVGGFGHLSLIGRSGFMTHAESEKGIRLFAKEVLPRLREIKPMTPE